MKKSMSAFIPQSVCTTLMIDLHCYDCWPALAALEALYEWGQLWKPKTSKNKVSFTYWLLLLPAHGPSNFQECAEGRRVLCGNVVLDKPSDQLVQRVANRVYDACRANTLKIVGFPQFQTVITAIQNVAPESDAKQYQVTVRKHDRLVVLQALASKWLDTEFKDQTIQEIESHNERFNSGGDYWHAEEERPPLSSYCFGIFFHVLVLFIIL